MKKNFDDAALRAIWEKKQRRYHPVSLMEPLKSLMKNNLARKVRNIGDISAAWNTVLPPEMLEHATLVNYSQGVLTVSVSSASHRFQLQTFLSGGGLDTLRKQCKRALNRVKLIPGTGQQNRI